MTANSKSDAFREAAMGELNPNWSVYSTMVSGIVQAGEHLGAAVDSLLIKAGIERQLLRDPEHRFEVSRVLRLAELIARDCQTPELGLYVGRILHINGLNLQFHMSTVCNTFREYLNLIPSVLRIVGDIGEVVVQPENEYIRLEWRPLWRPGARQRFISDMMLTYVADIVNALCILPVPVEKAHLSYSKPQDLKLLRDNFGNSLYFGQTISCLYFSRESLDYPLTRFFSDVTSTLTRPLDYLFSNNQVQDAFLNDLRRTLLRSLPQGEVTIDRIAEALSLSRRTLQRRLSERDTQFLQVLQEVRAELALRYLTDERLTVTEIAFLLGYSDLSSFSSAFKSWHGMSPVEYRRR